MMKILIAEDDSVSALILRNWLEKLGREVVVARDGADAWEQAQHEDVRLVISDWMMPRMDGIELCRRLRQRADRLYTYVILLTAKPQREDRIAALQAGADDLLIKPLDRGELQARLQVAHRILTMQEELRNRSKELEAMHDVLERQNVRLAELAVCDSLTGLKNRRHFHEVLEPSHSFAARNHLPLSLVMLDVDRFKSYNDTFGHPAGDLALKRVASLLRDNAREHDVVARYGGEEFVILLPATDVDAARAVCERLRATIAEHPWTLRPITASLGVATIFPPAGTSAQLVEEADRALYHSKKAGRNRTSHFLETILPTA
jgi:two-component system chemotaxis response regulator CheY